MVLKPEASREHSPAPLTRASTLRATTWPDNETANIVIIKFDMISSYKQGFMFTMHLFSIFIFVFCCVVVRSCNSTPWQPKPSPELEQPSLKAILHVNKKAVSGGSNVYEYEAGDEIDVSCATKNINDDVHSYSIIHQWHGINITMRTINSIHNIFNNKNYTMIGYDFDSTSEIYCVITREDIVMFKSAPMKLLLKPVSDKVINESMSVIRYSGNSSINQSCNDDAIPRIIIHGTYVPGVKHIIPSDSGLIFFCENITTSYKNKRLILERKLYQFTKYIYAMEPKGLPLLTRIGIGLGVVACVGLVAIIFFLRRNKIRPSEATPPLYENMEIADCPNGLIYAELDTLRAPTGTHLFQTTEDSPYAQISIK